MYFQKCQCAVPENVHILPTEGIGISWGMGGSVSKTKQRNVKLTVIFRGVSERGGSLRAMTTTTTTTTTLLTLTLFHVGGMDIFFSYRYIVNNATLFCFLNFILVDRAEISHNKTQPAHMKKRLTKFHFECQNIFSFRYRFISSVLREKCY